MLDYMEALIGEGARGPMNVQFRRDRLGKWKVQEINFRHTGSTLCQFQAARVRQTANEYFDKRAA
jgi:hypothetical protein